MRRSRRKDAAGGTKVAESTCSINQNGIKDHPLFCNALHGPISSALKVGGSLWFFAQNLRLIGSRLAAGLLSSRQALRLPASLPGQVTIVCSEFRTD